MEIKKFFQSSHNPQEVSLTVQSVFKVVIFVVGYYAVKQGFDPMIATTQVEAIRDLVISTIPAGFAVYHAIIALYGLVRKVFVVKTS